jgi:hypothetical protein
MSRVQYKQFDQLSFADFEVYSNLPDHPIWSRAAEQIDFLFADDICAHLYSGRGQYPYAPSLKLKLHLVQRYYNLSDREMEERVIGDLFIKRFAGLPVAFTGFDHSTFGLDRSRMGSELFDACHHHILAQAKQKGIWGNNKDLWLVDSFPTHGAIARRSAYRLIQQGMLRIINPLKRSYPALHQRLMKEVRLSTLQTKFPHAATEEQRLSAFSELVVQAFGLLYWFESAPVRPMFWSWSRADRQLASLESQALLYKILTQYVHPEDPEDPNAPFKKRTKSERPQDLVVSAVDPDVRRGYKSKSVKFTGDKVQVVQSTLSGLVLTAEPIPGNEDDGKRLLELVDRVWTKHGVKPAAVVGDTAYGTGRNRTEFAERNVVLSAPIWSQFGASPTGTLSHESFTYDPVAKTVTCPNGQVTNKSVYNAKKEGTQYKFLASACASCPMRPNCTTAEKAGRTVFISDYYELHQQAKAFNETEEGKALQSARPAVERKNNELKNHQGLGRARTRSREARRRDVKLASIVANLKVMVKQVGSLTLSFCRKRVDPHTRDKSAHLAVQR